MGCEADLLTAGNLSGAVSSAFEETPRMQSGSVERQSAKRRECVMRCIAMPNGEVEGPAEASGRTQVERSSSGVS
jgi:hypothetical protein